MVIMRFKWEPDTGPKEYIKRGRIIMLLMPLVRDNDGLTFQTEEVLERIRFGH
jgi:hypothetical protein